MLIGFLVKVANFTMNTQRNKRNVSQPLIQNRSQGETQILSLSNPRNSRSKEVVEFQAMKEKMVKMAVEITSNQPQTMVMILKTDLQSMQEEMTQMGAQLKALKGKGTTDQE